VVHNCGGFFILGALTVKNNLLPIDEIVTRVMVVTSGKWELQEESFDWIGFYNNGERHYDYPVKDGHFNGYCRYWDEKGILRVEEYYLNGWLNGCRREYDEKGRLILQERYGQYGRREGIQVVFDEKGTVKARTLFVRGIPVDNWLHDVVNTRTLNEHDILRIDDDETERVCLSEMGIDNFLNRIE